MSQGEVKPGSIKLPSMTSWLDVLRAALPPSGVLLVGAGAGDGPWVQWLHGRGITSGDVPVLLVEGDEQQYRHLQNSLPAHAGWALRRDVVGASGGRAIFHRASNPAESGLLKPESLQQLWAHLGTEQSIVIEDAVTLDVLEQEMGGQINWLVLDCLPAASLLEGGARLLVGLDVALVRVAQDPSSGQAADQQAVDEVLRAAGLRCIHAQAERHPALAHVLYVRDAAQVQERAQKVGDQLTLAQEAFAKEKAELTHAMKAAGQHVQATEEAQALAQEQAKKLGEQLKVMQAVWAKEKAELTQVSELAKQTMLVAEQARLQAEAKAAQLHQELTQAKGERDERNKVANNRKKQIEKLESDKAVLEQAKAELGRQIGERERLHKQEQGLLEQCRQELAQVKEEKEERNKIAINRKKQLEQLEVDKAALEGQLAKSGQQLEQARRESEEHLKNEKELTRKLAGIPTSSSRGSIGGGKGNANIEDLIEDLGLFFYGKHIVYVDVGAYVGDVFLKLTQSKKFRLRDAHLFEPNPDSYARMTQNIAVEDVPILHAYNLAVGLDKEAVQFIKGGKMTKMLDQVGQELADHGDVFTVRSVSLDSQARIFTDGQINLLKIDVEGRELDVLEGARQLLQSQSVDILYIEAGFNRAGTQQTYFTDIDGFLQPLGYRVLRIYEQKEEWMSGLPVLRRCNLAYMSEKFAQAHPLNLMRELQKLQQEVGLLKAAQ